MRVKIKFESVNWEKQASTTALEVAHLKWRASRSLKVPLARLSEENKAGRGLPSQSHLASDIPLNVTDWPDISDMRGSRKSACVHIHKLSYRAGLVLVLGLWLRRDCEPMGLGQ